MNGPTMRRLLQGSTRPTSNPPRSRRRASITISIMLAMPSMCGRGSEQLRGNFRYAPALVARRAELVLARLALSLATGDRRRAVRCAAGDLVQRHLALVSVRQADD